MARQHRDLRRRIVSVLAHTSALGVFMIFGSGCSTLQYLGQATHGQFKLINRAKPLSEVIAQERTPTRLKRLLEEVAPIKKFGESRGLKATRNYESFVQWDQPAVSWVVSAAPEFGFEPRTWSFPVVGSFTYLGWFDRELALKQAEELRAQGWDADVRGAQAFSTLGWFRDPIVSTMLSDGPESMGDLVNVILHESVHVTWYVPAQSTFNESLADFVADRLTEEYLKTRFGLESQEWRSYQKAEVERAARGEKIRTTYLDLAKLYSSQKTDGEKREQKRQAFQALRESIQAKREFNNATLVQYKTYAAGKRLFPALFAKVGSQWEKFWECVKREFQKDRFPKVQVEDLEESMMREVDRC